MIISNGSSNSNGLNSHVNNEDISSHEINQ